MRHTSIKPFMLLLLLSGCALSPQVIHISPVLDTAGLNNRQTGTSISIMVKDTRTTQVIGSRGGVYSDTALLTAAENMNSNIKSSLTSALSGLGYNVVSGNGENILSINLSELNYTSEKNNALTTITTSATVNANCRNLRNTLDNDYRITNRKDFITAPTQEENENIINATLASALNRIFNDDNFLECMGG